MTKLAAGVGLGCRSWPTVKVACFFLFKSQCFKVRVPFGSLEFEKSGNLW